MTSNFLVMLTHGTKVLVANSDPATAEQTSHPKIQLHNQLPRLQTTIPVTITNTSCRLNKPTSTHHPTTYKIIRAIAQSSSCSPIF